MKETLVKSLNDIIRIVKWDKINIDSWISKLHYRVTMMCFLGITAGFTYNEFTNLRIVCNKRAMDDYCMTQSLFTLIRKVGGTDPEYPEVQPGISAFDEDEYELRYHMYYRWVPLIIFLQALSFKVPRIVWKKLEGGRIASIARQLHGDIGIRGDPSYEANKEKLITYLVAILSCDKSGTCYQLQYVFCQLLYIVNIIVNVLFLNSFFNGEFKSYGYNVMRYSPNGPYSTVHPMDFVFPKVVKCRFGSYSRTGLFRWRNTICMLPDNYANDKIFLFEWFWFVTLLILTVSEIFYKFVTTRCLKRRIDNLGLSSEHEKVKKVLSRCDSEHLFLLEQLSQNINHMVLNEVLMQVHDKLEESVKNVPKKEVLTKGNEKLDESVDIVPENKVLSEDNDKLDELMEIVPENIFLAYADVEPEESMVKVPKLEIV